MKKESPGFAVPLLLAASVVLSPTLVGSPAVAAHASPASSFAEQPLETVTVTGQGDVAGRPDVLDVNLAVEATSPTVAEALKRANTAAARIRDTFVHGGVAKDDLQSSGVTINAMRKDDGTVTGYTVNQGLTAKVRNLPRAGALLSAAIASGGDATRLNGASFSIDDDTALLAEARKLAFADARKRADLYAREAGRSLGRVVKVTESTPAYWPVAGQQKYAAADAVPLEPGRQQLTASVTVEWLLAPVGA
jgi:uncharacterized protein